MCMVERGAENSSPYIKDTPTVRSRVWLEEDIVTPLLMTAGITDLAAFGMTALIIQDHNF